MSGWILVVAIVVLMGALGARWWRREERQSDLARLDEEIRLTKFWNYSAETEQKHRTDMIAERKNWRNNIKFELGNWTAFLIGAVILLIAVMLWFGEDPSHTWDQLWNYINDNGKIVVPLGLAAFWVYRLHKRLGKAEKEISWQNQMLKAVKDHAEDMRKGSIDDILELKKRLDRLEGRST